MYSRIAILLLACAMLCLGGCSLMPHSGPSQKTIKNEAKEGINPEGVTLVEVTEQVARKMETANKHPSLAEVFGETKAARYKIGPGDVLNVSIWETPPAILFRKVTLDSTLGAMGAGSETLPPQMVMQDGCITVPFAGRIKVTGRTIPAIESDIAERLEGQANNPQVMVNVVTNINSQVAVIGDVAKSGNIPLSPKGAKLLDALAEAGGVQQPLTKVSLQLSRNGRQASMPLDKIVEDPKQNLQLLPGDVVTAQFQPWTYTILGAVGQNSEIPFETAGISLAQALSRAGGLNDFRADPGGIFVFRYEAREKLDKSPTPDKIGEKIPVVYQIDFKEPSAFFATQNFPMRDKDVVYVANMPSAELQKFLGMVGLVLSPTLNLARYNLEASD